MNYLNVYKNGTVELSEHEYAGAEGELSFAVHFDTEMDAKLAMSVILRVNEHNVPNTITRRLEAEIEEYKEINRRLVSRIDGLLGHQEASANYANAATSLLRRICNTLAVGAVTQATHRERNEVSRNIVQSIVDFLKTPVDVWLNSQVDMDDIPF